MKRRLMVAFATSAIAVATVGIATPAHAIIDSIVYVQEVGGGSTTGSMAHEDNGDIFYIWDRIADGHGVRGSIIDGSGTTVASKYNGNGNGSKVELTYDIKSGNKYYMKICLVDGASDTTPLKCSSRVLYE